MTLTLYFRLIIASIFQPCLRLDYNTAYFMCPELYAKDGFSVSLQINHSTYCSSDNDYRKFGFNWEEVEFGFTSIDEPLMEAYAETSRDTTKTVGRIPLILMERVFEKHGGIDWEKTLSIENMKKFTNK